MPKMKLNQNKMLIAAAVVMALGVGAAYYSIRRAVPARQSYQFPTVKSAPIIPRDESALATQPGDIAAVTLSRAISAGVASGHEAELLSSAVYATVEMYLAGSIEAYEAWLQAEGLEPTAVWAENRERYREDIEMKFATLRDAPMDDQGVVVRPALPVRELAPDPERVGTGASTHSKKRLDRLKSDERGRRAAEVVIPAQVNVRSATNPGDPGSPVRINTKIGLIYHWSPAQEKWMLTELRVYGVPAGTYAAMPAL